MTIPSDFGTFLTWIGSDAVIGAVLVFLWNWQLLATLKTWIRIVLLAVVGIVLAAGSYVGITYIPAGVVEQIQPYWRLVVTVVTIVLSIVGVNEFKTWWTYRKDLRQANLEERRARILAIAAPTTPRQSVLGELYGHPVAGLNG